MFTTNFKIGQLIGYKSDSSILTKRNCWPDNSKAFYRQQWWATNVITINFLLAIAVGDLRMNSKLVLVVKTGWSEGQTSLVARFLLLVELGLVLLVDTAHSWVGWSDEFLDGVEGSWNALDDRHWHLDALDGLRLGLWVEWLLLGLLLLGLLLLGLLLLLLDLIIDSFAAHLSVESIQVISAIVDSAAGAGIVCTNNKFLVLDSLTRSLAQNSWSGRLLTCLHLSRSERAILYTFSLTLKMR